MSINCIYIVIDLNTRMHSCAINLFQSYCLSSYHHCNCLQFLILSVCGVVNEWNRFQSPSGYFSLKTGSAVRSDILYIYIYICSVFILYLYVCVCRTYIRLRRLHSMSTLFACPLISLVVWRYFTILYTLGSPAGPLYCVQYGLSELVPKGPIWFLCCNEGCIRIFKSIFDFPSHFIQGPRTKYDYISLCMYV